MQRGNTNQKKARTPTLITDKVDFRGKNITRQNEGNYKLETGQLIKETE